MRIDQRLGRYCAYPTARMRTEHANREEAARDRDAEGAGECSSLLACNDGPGHTNEARLASESRSKPATRL